MDIVWRMGVASVRDVHRLLERPVAYTTLMTTMDRLFRKGLLTREKEGRAFVYEPAATRDELERELAAGLLHGLADGGARLDPILSNFVEAVGNLDGTALDELERLIREKRQSLGGRKDS